MGSLVARLGAVVYLDTNVVIYIVENFAPYAAVLRELLQALQDGALIAITSELTIAEVLVRPIEQQNERAQRAYFTFLRPTPALRVVPVTRSVLVAAAGIRATTRVKLPDAIHLATALEQQCTALLTNDRSIRTVTGLPILYVSDLVGA